MGKNRKNRKRKKAALASQKAIENSDSGCDDDDELAAAAAQWASAELSPKTIRKKPKRDYPSPFFERYARNRFLRRSTDEEFRAVLDTCYKGFVWETTPKINEAQLQKALKSLPFRIDMTQPSGLGGKCVPTIVKRCLMGDPGATYKYLGLRMFALPWSKVPEVDHLNRYLEERTLHHLIGNNTPSSNHKYHVTLINQMNPRYHRPEPMFQEQCSVSWHADSSLDHFSTIAVYQTISQDNKGDDFKDWEVALRVTRDAQGPKAKPLGQIQVDDRCPPIAVNLPSHSAYFMLDDFNHHHQHAVLRGSDQRFSSTHRRLRSGHQVAFWIDKCKRTCKTQAFTLKQVRGEQALLNEIEFDWLRQFYIQGQDHYECLWKFWKRPLAELFNYWQTLEKRTLEIARVLRQSSRARCGLGHKPIFTVDPSLFAVLSDSLKARSRKRQLWREREQDKAFARLSPRCRPLPFPVGFEGRNGEIATTPLAEILVQESECAKAWGKAWETKDRSQLPTRDDWARCS